MVIYLDLMIIFDFAVCFVFLTFIEKMYEKKIKYKLIILSSFLSSIIMIISLYNYFFLNMMKILSGIGIGLLAYKKGSLKVKAVKIASFLALNFALIGFLQSFRITKWVFLFSSVMGILVLFSVEKVKKFNIYSSSLQYNVIVNVRNIRYQIKGYLDTGNTSKFMDLPIVYLNEKYKEETIEDVLVKVESVAGNVFLKGYIPCYFSINDNGFKAFNVIIVYVKMKKDCLLNPYIFL